VDHVVRVQPQDYAPARRDVQLVGGPHGAGLAGVLELPPPLLATHLDGQRSRCRPRHHDGEDVQRREQERGEHHEGDDAACGQYRHERGAVGARGSGLERVPAPA
jgi:hypothetical protein